jgi:hypothetical protein
VHDDGRGDDHLASRASTWPRADHGDCAIEFDSTPDLQLENAADLVRRKVDILPGAIAAPP